MLSSTDQMPSYSVKRKPVPRWFQGADSLERRRPQQLSYLRKVQPAASRTYQPWSSSWSRVPPRRTSAICGYPARIASIAVTPSIPPPTTRCLGLRKRRQRLRLRLDQASRVRDGPGEMTEDEFVRLLEASFELIAASSARGALLYACMDWRHMAEMLAAGRSSLRCIPP
jgi:hypothetical protein